MLKSTDCYLLLMFVFLGIFSRHFVNRFIYMQIYNFSLCKEVKDNHLNVVLLRQQNRHCLRRRVLHVYMCSITTSLPASAPLQTSSSKRTCTHRVKD